jgi:hypothetical protein
MSKLNRNRAEEDAAWYEGEMAKRYKTWTEIELAQMHKLAQEGRTLAEIAQAMERSEWGVYAKLRRTTKPVKGKRNKGKTWHAADVVRIQKYRELGMTWEEIAKRMQRTVDGVKSFYSTYVPNPKKKWTANEESFLLAVMQSWTTKYPDEPLSKLYEWAAEMFGREISAVRMKHHRLLKEQRLGQERVDSSGREDTPHRQDSTAGDGRPVVDGNAGILHQPEGEGRLD